MPPAEWVCGVGLGILYVAAIVVMRHRSGLFTDEVNHYLQIALFRHGRFDTVELALTTIPGYHAIVAATEWLFGADSLYAARLINAGFGLVAIAGFHALRRRVRPGTETLATAQFAALPILTPLLFLVYTDVLALALLLWATFATLTERHRMAAALLSVLVCVRQNEVVWAGFLAAVAVWPVWRELGPRGWRTIAARALPYAVPVAGFVAFWCWNGSISLSPREAALHPDLGVHAGNLFFVAVLAGVLLPLQTVSGLADFARRARRRPWLLALPPLLFAAFWYGFHVDHP
ncbi:MAG TPA: hypothetical protein VGC30_05485, partial [Dokdonella sp.]